MTDTAPKAVTVTKITPAPDADRRFTYQGKFDRGQAPEVRRVRCTACELDKVLPTDEAKSLAADHRREECPS